MKNTTPTNRSRDHLSTPSLIAATLAAISFAGCAAQSGGVRGSSANGEASSVLTASEASVSSPSLEPLPLSDRSLEARPRAAASAVLASFSQAQRDAATRPMTSPLRSDWHFIPRSREGVMLGELTLEQKTLVHRLLRTALSDAGYLRATDIIWLETVLYELSNQRPMRDPNKYGLLIFGDPGDADSAWGWRLEGHHLSVNLTYAADGIGVTPMFMGTNPAVVQQGPLAGKRVLAGVHDQAIALAASMSPSQRKAMTLAQTPRDVITGPGRERSLTQPVGIAASELSARQRLALLGLMQGHVNSLEARHAERVGLADLLGATDPSAIDDYRFAWAGPIDIDQPFYYRIQGSRFVVEYSVQNPTHVHAVLHDLTDPLQADLLKRHFEQYPHD